MDRYIGGSIEYGHIKSDVTQNIAEGFDNDGVRFFFGVSGCCGNVFVKVICIRDVSYMGSFSLCRMCLYNFPIIVYIVDFNTNLCGVQLYLSE